MNVYVHDFRRESYFQNVKRILPFHKIPGVSVRYRGRCGVVYNVSAVHEQRLIGAFCFSKIMLSEIAVYSYAVFDFVDVKAIVYDLCAVHGYHGVFKSVAERLHRHFAVYNVSERNSRIT